MARTRIASEVPIGGRERTVRMDRTLVCKWKCAIGALIISVSVILIPRAAYSQAPGFASDPLKQDEVAKSKNKSDELRIALSQVQWAFSANRKIACSLLPRRSPLSPDRIKEIVVLMAAIENYGWRLRIDPDLSARSATGARSPKNTIADAPPVTAGAPSSAPDVESASQGRRAGRPVSPRLYGSVEMRESRLVVILKNLDRKRAFSGTIRVTLSDGKRGTEMTPVAIDLQPSEEKLVPIDDPSTPYGDSVLTVYDGKQVVQLIRSLPFGTRPNAANQQSATQPPVVEPTVTDDEAVLESIGEIEGAPAQKIRKPDN